MLSFFICNTLIITWIYMYISFFICSVRSYFVMEYLFLKYHSLTMSQPGLLNQNTEVQFLIVAKYMHIFIFTKVHKKRSKGINYTTNFTKYINCDSPSKFVPLNTHHSLTMNFNFRKCQQIAFHCSVLGYTMYRKPFYVRSAK